MLGPILVTLGLGFASVATPAPALEGERPNLVVFVADDLGWNSVGYHGGPVATPHIDALAQSGVRMERFYALPACTPALLGEKVNYSLLTNDLRDSLQFRHG